MSADRTLHACPKLPKESSRIRRQLVRKYGLEAEEEFWRYVSWYESRHGITNLQQVWIQAINRTAEKYRSYSHQTGLPRPNRFRN